MADQGRLDPSSMKTQAGREAADLGNEIQDRFDRIKEGLKSVGQMHDDINDHLDHIQSRIPTITGGKPLPQPRPRAAGPDAAGNDRSSNAPRSASGAMKVPSIAKQYLGD